MGYEQVYIGDVACVGGNGWLDRGFGFLTTGIDQQAT
jgi:hypothetical protein